MPRIRICRASFLLSLALAMPLMAASENRRPELVSWLRQLGDPDPHARSIARQNLMSLSSLDLPLLRDVVAGQPHLTPAQADPLESIVTYIATRGSLLTQQLGMQSAFLGITLAPTPADHMDEQNEPIQVGVTVANRLFGFVAYRYLEDGDVILALGRVGQLRPTRTGQELKDAVHALQPGETIAIRLVRGGVLLHVQFPLDAEPRIATDHSMPSPSQLEVSIDRVRDDAQLYWDTQFRALVEPAA